MNKYAPINSSNMKITSVKPKKPLYMALLSGNWLIYLTRTCTLAVTVTAENSDQSR